MTGRGGGQRPSAAAMREQPPVNIVFKYLTQKAQVQIWLVENLAIRIEGKIVGFDEFMNITVGNAIEIKTDPRPEQQARVPLGTIVLKGDNVCLISSNDVSI